MIRFYNSSGLFIDYIDYFEFNDEGEVITEDFLFLNSQSRWWNKVEEGWCLDEEQENYLCLKYPQLVYKIKETECL